MDPNASPFLAIHEQEFLPYDSNQNDGRVLQALYGFSPIDPIEGLFDLDPGFNTFGFLDQDQYQGPVELSASPGTAPSPSLPSSPFSLTDDSPELGVVDASAHYNPELSPAALSVLSALSDTSTLSDTSEAKSTKTDLAGFEYHPFTRKWVCPKCNADFVSTHEARRHVKTAAKCTGKKVECLRCGDRIHASQWSRKRHFTAKKCQKGGRKRGTPTYTVHNAYVDVETDVES